MITQQSDDPRRVGGGDGSKQPGDTTTVTASEVAVAKRLAVIDVGSNSVRLVVAELQQHGGFRILDEERESTRLAKDLDTSGRLDETSIRHSLAALRRFKKIASGLNVSHIRTIATCAVREADNGGDFRRLARSETGLNVEIISSRQEAKLAFVSVANAFDISEGNIAIADIGGGSTEIVMASGGHIEEIYNTRLGAVRLSEHCAGDHQRLVGEIDRELRRRVKKPPFIPRILYGSGGTCTNLAAMLIASKGQVGHPIWGYRATRADVRHVLDRLQKMSAKQRRNVPGLNADRADIIVAGLAIIDRTMKRLRVNLLQVHNRGVRDGMMLTMLDQFQPKSAGERSRSAAVERFAASCGVDLAHAKHVRTLASELFEQLAEPFNLRSEDRTLLEVAAILQDTGYLINYDQHHKHSYQLILNSQLHGFRRRELELIANVARYHRGAKPKRKHENFARLREEDQIRVRAMVAILRLAGGLDRSRSQKVQSTSSRVSCGQTTISVACRGEDPEVDLWAARRRSKLFSQTFNTDVSIVRL